MSQKTPQAPQTIPTSLTKSPKPSPWLSLTSSLICSLGFLSVLSLSNPLNPLKQLHTLLLESHLRFWIWKSPERSKPGEQLEEFTCLGASCQLLEEDVSYPKIYRIFSGSNEEQDIMRFEATLSQRKGEALVQLAQELGMTKSQLMDEALGLYLKIVLEARKGKRLAILQSELPSGEGNCELTTPALALLEWTAQRQVIELEPEEFKTLVELSEHPSEPNQALKQLIRKYRK